MTPSTTKEGSNDQQKQPGKAPDTPGSDHRIPFFSRAIIQPKLSINTPGDEYEREADHTADQVMRMNIPGSSLQNKGHFFPPSPGSVQRKAHQPEDELDKEILHRKELPTLPVQRKCSSCEEEDSHLQRKENGEASTPDSALDNYVSSLSSSGQALPETARGFFEPRFGQDFSQVRVHSDSAAAESAQSINALAYTTGNNIVFNEGKLSPESDDGKRLLAHELTHVVQQGNDHALQTSLIQTDLAVDPTAPDAVGRALTATQTRTAIQWNRAVFSDPTEIAILREVLGIPQAPSVIDEDFITALVQYQANFGLSQDGLLGSGTASRLADELRGEATTLGAAADVGTASEMALNPAERRMRLRARVASRLGTLLHQGFIGPADHPTGIVTARSGFTVPGVPTATNGIGLNYTGANADNTRWLQFTFSQMSAIDPATNTRVFQTGVVHSSGGDYNFSNAATFNWNLDSAPASGSMYYEAAGANTRTPGSSTEIFDQPGGWAPVADTFAATFGTRPAAVRVIKGFDSFLVANNTTVLYHVRWNLYFNFNTTTAPAPDVRGNYEALAGGTVGRLPADRKAVLDARFGGNTIP